MYKNIIGRKDLHKRTARYLEYSRIDSQKNQNVINKKINWRIVMKSKILALAILILGSASFSFGQEKLESNPKYKLLATTRTSTMQKELDEVSAQGYRVKAGSPTSGTEIVVFLEREATAKKPYKYKLLATSRTGTMQKELNEMANVGYRLIPSTMVSKKWIFGGEIVMLMELPPKVKRRYEYKLLATNLTSTLQKEVTEAKKAGFILVGMMSRNEHMVIMERKLDL